MDITSTANGVTLGLDTFGDVTEGEDGRPLTHAQTIRNLVDEFGGNPNNDVLPGQHD